MPAAALDADSLTLPFPQHPELLQQAEELVAAGQHQEALEITAAWQAQQAGQASAAAPAPVAAQLHGLRARSHVQLGDLKQAIGEFTAAIRLVQGTAEPPAMSQRGTWGVEQAQHAQQLCQLLLGRSSVYEQHEQLELALADAEQAGRLQHPPAVAALLTAQRLRRACKA